MADPSSAGLSWVVPYLQWLGIARSGPNALDAWVRVSIGVAFGSVIVLAILVLTT
ncbi:MAG: hypothetical protein ACRDGW_08815 [Actinomycetota bacterium]